jgi:hypothetical protein
MTLVTNDSLYNFFDDTIDINCNEVTRSYIVSIFVDIKISDDFSTKSITLLYNQAIENYDFETFRKLGDWLFFAKSMYPKSLNSASPEYYNAIAQCSYYTCYRILHGQWLLYEELADEFPRLTADINRSLSRSSDNTFLLNSLL